jgi:hypothetical protein
MTVEEVGRRIRKNFAMRWAWLMTVRMEAHWVTNKSVLAVPYILLELEEEYQNSNVRSP